MATTRSYTINGVVDSAKLDASIAKITSSKTYKIEVQADGTQTSQLSKSIDTVTTKTGEATRTISTFNTKTGELTGTTQRLTSTLNNTSMSLSEMATNFTDIIKKVTLFGAATAVIGLFTAACGEAVSVMSDFDDKLTDFKKVSDLSGESLTNYVSKLDELGASVYRSSTEMLEGATVFKQAGYSDDDAAKLAQISALYQNVADKEISASEAGDYLVATMKAFNITAENSQEIIDKTNEVSNDFALTSTDISSALEKTASTFATYGNSIDETIGMITAAVEQMPNQSGKVARGLSSIGAEIVKLANDSGTLQYIVDGTTKSIALFNEQGEMLNTFEVLGTIKEDWDKMSSSEKSALALTLGMKTQMSTFTAEMNNFDDAVKASGVSMASFGSASEENAKRADSWKVALQNINREFTSLVNGTQLKNILTNFINLGTEILKFINDAKALEIVLVDVALIFTAKWIPAIVSYISTNFNAYVEAQINEMLGLTTAEETATVATMSLATAFNLLVVGISAIVMAYNMYNAAQERATQNALSAFDTLEQTNEQISEAVASVQDETTSKQQLISIMSTLDSSYDTEAAQLKNVNDLRQDAIDKLYKEAQAKAKTTIESTGSEYQKAKKAVSESYTVGAYKGTYNFESRAKASEFFSQKLDELNKKLQEQGNLSLSDSSNMKYYENQLEKVNNKLDSSKSIITDYEDAQKVLTENQQQWLNSLQNTEEDVSQLSEQEELLAEKFDKTNDSTIDSVDNLSYLGNTYSDIIDKLNDYNKAKAQESSASEDTDDNTKSSSEAFYDLADALGVSTEQLQDMADASGMSLDQFVEQQAVIEQTQADLDKLNDKYQDNISSLSNMNSAYDTISKAVEEFNSNGELTNSTITSLLSLNDEYLASLSLENGQLTVNKQSLIDLANAKIDDAEATLTQKTQAELAAIANNTYNTELAAGGAASNAAVTAAQAAGKAMLESGKDATTSAEAWTQAWAAMANQAGVDTSKFTAEQKKLEAQLEKGYQTSYTSLETLRSKIGDTASSVASGASSAAKSSAGSAKSASDAWKTQAEDYQKFIENQYKTGQISEEEYLRELYALNESYYGKLSGKGEKYLSEYQSLQQKIYDGVQDLAKESVKATEKSMQASIDSLKKQETKALDEIQDKIDELKKEEKQRVNEVENRITALKSAEKAEDEYWQNQIDALKKANNELDKQNKLMEYQESLAQAKQSKQMVLGESGQFEYKSDESAVSSAEQELSDYQDQLDYDEKLQQLEDYQEAAEKSYETQIEQLEGYKDYLSNYYDEQIEAMENYKSQVQEQYDARVSALEEQLSNYKEHEDEMIKAQAKALLKEQANWQLRLFNLKTFVAAYNSLINSLGGTSVISTSSTSTTATKHASGIANIKSDEVAMVGDSPNNELVIGSKLNGIPMSLSSGSGVVNAKSTNTLAGVLNSIGQLTRSAFTGSTNTATTNTSQSTNINISNLNVQSENGEELVNYLQNFGMQMTQEAFAN